MTEFQRRRGRKRGLEERPVSVLTAAPKEIRIVDLAESRASEIEFLTRACETVGGAKRVFQTLPRHMRRRAMSHNSKRLPRRLQGQAAKEYELQEQKKMPSKRPSRRHRRRPKHLLSEYSRRQRKNVWLETHIWHAKRFKMADLWGYRIPLHPCEKSTRATYRAVSKHCLLKDVSYLCCLEIRGPEQCILDGLKHLTSPQAGRNFAAKASLSGCREGETVLYNFQKYPTNAIGCMTFLWKPSDQSKISDNGGEYLIEQRQLWLTCHPSCYKQTWEELCKAFRLSPCTSVEMENKKNRIKNDSATNGIVTLTSLKDGLVRYRLWGPLSQVVLGDLLKQPVLVTTETSSEERWWEVFYKNGSKASSHEEQWDMWRRMKDARSPAELPPHCVLSLTVRDPSIFLPPKKGKCTDKKSDAEGYGKDAGDAQSVTAGLSPKTTISPLWCGETRQSVGVKLSEQEINRRRSQLLVPGSFLDLGDEESRVPIMLIQRPGYRGNLLDSSRLSIDSGFGSGWDMIIPSGWGMAFWVSLVYRGARVAGKREEDCIWRELGDFSFPSDYPDTAACQAESENERKDLESKYHRYPPAKRPNFVKLGIVNPFYFGWQQLVTEWNNHFDKTTNSVQDTKLPSLIPQFFVLRDRALLKEVFKQLQKRSLDTDSSVNQVSNVIMTELRSALVGVRLTMYKRGTPEKFAAIYSVLEEDLIKLRENPDYSGPKEPIHKGLDKELTKDCTAVRTDDQCGTLKTDERDLGINGNMLNSQSRQIIGFVKSGAFSLCLGSGAGIGFCSALALLHVKQPLVGLIRAQNSSQYRFVQIHVLL